MQKNNNFCLRKMVNYSLLKITKYVTDHWKEDEFYGFQFLNGANPNVIVRCSELPPNFAVTEEMVQPFLEEGTTLQKEMEKGNIFLCDQTIMDGVPTRVIDGKPMQVSSGFCLLYMTPESKLMPIAIQLGQLPSETNPIFLPSDSETDWLLAKMFIRNADFNQLQAIHHLKNSHYLAEVYNISTLRNLPEIHPLYKLLIPHFRHNIPSNINGRNLLLAPTGPLGLVCIMRRAHPGTTYTTLCLPDNIAARGLESVPNFYYRDDGLKLWDVIHSFVKAMMEYYYPSDEEVCKDSELQAWISEIFTHGFLGNKESGIPENFSTVEELIKFITMVIFNSSGQHATTNHSQFDYLSWLPNGPLLLVQPPPTTKGRSSMKTVLETLPPIGDSLWFSAMVPLGSYPDEQFDELVPKQIIKGFQVELKHLSETIDARNSQLEVPYNYFNPSQIENSINV
uniref:Lipoxygenase domain-containing protein n=1 Tax=Sphaeramia orbicularis TaxID=375764 RepID=A0A673AD51_9TELE